MKAMNCFVLGLVIWRVCSLAAQAEEPIILPPVTIVGEDKSVFAPRPLEIIPAIPGGPVSEKQEWTEKGAGASSLFSLFLCGGGYDYFSWKITGANTSTLLLLERKKQGKYGNQQSLNNFSEDKFTFKNIFPLGREVSLTPLLHYRERGGVLLHPDLISLGGPDKISLEHQIKNASMLLSLKGVFFKNVKYEFSPHYQYSDIKDELINTDTRTILERQSYAADVKLSLDKGLHSLRAGLKWEGEAIKDFSSGDLFIVFFQDNFRTGKFPALRFALEMEYLHHYRFPSQLNPSLAVSYLLDRETTLKGLVKKESILPSPQLYFGDYRKINLDLRPAILWDISLMVQRQFFDHLYTQIKIFQKIGEDLHAYRPADDLWQPFNMPSLYRYGMELTLEQFLRWANSDLRTQISYCLEGILLKEGKAYPYRPAHRIDLDLSYQFKRFQALLKGEYRGISFADLGASKEISPAFLLGIQISLGLTDKISLFMEGENLLDSDTYLLDDYPAKGRSLNLGLQLKF